MRISVAKILAFFGLCKRVEAAGGWVVNERGEWLLIYRGGRWDLPKGHVERGETPAEAAVREVEEETGVRVEPVRFLRKTRHTYIMYGRRELKRTWWFEMRACSDGALQPQREEGIERVAWLMPEEVRSLLPGMFPTIRRVLNEQLKINNEK